ncbi:hypothetical protein C1X05_03825 [Laceyella sacchari]|uniref:Uncharacterized protein n=1 Tax=Laceyella tengchongensis TaxID=574699 RepID=A0AA46ACZ4_9BACL|nr:hypothetical protein [Laceyella tengchongensis]AUS08037.1 hypothetical protein C1X05_03825 [Laceyella sacchari]SMP01907.1 hypothetical protein SAMN06265361_101293 [Laceyella tengchongensis]
MGSITRQITLELTNESKRALVKSLEQQIQHGNDITTNHHHTLLYTQLINQIKSQWNAWLPTATEESLRAE